MGNCCKPERPNIKATANTDVNSDCCNDCGSTCNDRCYSTCCIVIIKKRQDSEREIKTDDKEIQ